MMKHSPSSATACSRESSLIANLEAAIECLTNRFRFLLLGSFCLFYLVVTFASTGRKLIWTDEFFTLYLSRLGARDLWAALLTGGDQHPLPFYLLHHLFLRTLGENPWALRLPATLGFLLMMLCVYQFVANRTSVAYGLAAMLLPLATAIYQYAYEARGYSLLLGFGALALLGWQQAEEPGRRRAAVLIMAVGATGGILSHYYTVLLLPAIAAAEMVRSLRRKSWNPAVWLVLGIPIVFLLVFLPLIKSSSGFAATFWGKASLNEVHIFYTTILGPALLCCVAVALLYRLLFSGSTSAAPSNKTFPVEEIVLGVVLASIPFIAYFIGKTITGVFAWRYAIGGVIGIAILFGLFCFRFFRGSAIAAWLIVLTLITFFSINAWGDMRMLAYKRDTMRHFISWLARTSKESDPLIIGNTNNFYFLSYYSPPALKKRYIYLVDAERSVKYLAQDTPDRSLWALNPWFKLNVRPYSSYVDSHPEMKVVIDPDPQWCWLLWALIDDGEKLAVTDRYGGSIFFSASAPEFGRGR